MALSFNKRSESGAVTVYSVVYKHQGIAHLLLPHFSPFCPFYPILSILSPSIPSIHSLHSILGDAGGDFRVDKGMHVFDVLPQPV
jgi:hypothetical protein